MQSTTGGQHNFAQIPRAEIQRSSFDRSCGTKTTFNAGSLVPIFVDEALPGDTMTMKANLYARLATPIFPVMDNMFLDSFFFAVPIRLIWDNWQKFNGEQVDPGDSTDFLVPQIVAGGGGFLQGDLGDYFGMPTLVAGISVSAFWHRAYNFIWNEWFRDENMQDSIVVDRDDGPDTVTDYVIKKRGKRHDYFTSCLPFAQKGPAVGVPTGGTATVISGGTGVPSFDIPGFTDVDLGTSISSANTFYTETADANGVASWNTPNLVADLSTATAVTVNEMREAFQIQRLLERDARGGSRYTEIVRSHFGVVSPDQRLQRPEYLGGGSQVMSLTAVPKTSSTSGTSPQGNLAAYGVSAGGFHGFSKSFTEHCVIIGLVSLRADLNYQQGLHRMFSRSTRFDFYWPALAHIGEQAVLNQELFMDGSGADVLTFGFQERWAEYRYKPSMITGQMRSNATGPLDPWHLAQDFASLPVLDSAFIEENPPIERIVAVTTEPDILFDSFFEYRCARPMPTYSVPGLIDHF